MIATLGKTIQFSNFAICVLPVYHSCTWAVGSNPVDGIRNPIYKLVYAGTKKWFSRSSRTSRRVNQHLLVEEKKCFRSLLVWHWKSEGVGP